MTNTTDRYLAPDWFTRNIFNPAVRTLTRIGISVMGSRELRVQGRKSGEWRSTPVNLLTLDGQEYLVAPRGITQWVRNLRVSGTGELRVGRRVDTFTAEEVPDADRIGILRAYLRKWSWETGAFFDGLKADAPDAQILEMAPKHPVFRITMSTNSGEGGIRTHGTV